MEKFWSFYAEILACLLASAVTWVLALTVLMPFFLLLMFSESFCNRFFVVFYAFAMRDAEKDVKPLRRKAFHYLHDHLRRRDASVALEVLEIGIGPGLNLEFYPENCRLTAIDPNPQFLDNYFAKAQKEHPEVEYKRTLRGVAEDMSAVEDSSVDVVVGTYVLCTVKDVDKSLREIHRVLKPGGAYVILEHGAFPAGDVRFWVQKTLAPLWGIIGHGCRLDRRCMGHIKRAGFSRVDLKEAFPFIQYVVGLFLRPNFFGIAVK